MDATTVDQLLLTQFKLLPITRLSISYFYVFLLYRITGFPIIIHVSSYGG
jgi:hypothetical protein